MLHFYYAQHTCALASHIALEEANATFTLKRVDFASKEQQQTEYLKINPKGRVPALITPQGILTETPAMLIYIAQMYPQSKLAPLDDPFALAELQAINSYLCSSLHVAHAHRMRGHRWTDNPAAISAMKKFVPVSVSACFEYIEEHVIQEPWIMGEQFSVADAYLFTIAQWMEGDGVDPSQFPKVAAHRQRVLERASVKKAIFEEAGS